MQCLGGRKTSRKLICTTCNEVFGSGPDKALAESVAFIRNQMAYPSGKGNDPPDLRGPVVQGLKTAIRPSGIPEFIGGQPFKITTMTDGTKNVEIYARSAEHIASILPHLARALGISEEETKQKLSLSEARRINIRLPLMHHPIQLGGPEAMRSMMKTCLTLWADSYGTDEVRKDGYVEARNFVASGGDALAQKLCLLDTRPFTGNELTTRFSDQVNFVYVASDSGGHVLGYFRLYNICGWCLELCPRGGIANSAACYVFNPAHPNIWSDKIEEVPLTYEWIADSQ